MHSLREYIQGYSTISDQDWNQIVGGWNRTVYKPGEYILRDGQICRKLYFLEAGFLRFFVTRDGEEITKFFTTPPYCFTAQRSFTQGLPTHDTIEAIEPSTVWEMPKSKAFDLLQLPAWSEFVRKLVQEVQFYTEEILEAVQNETAEARYIQMVEENNIILQKAPLKYIASYLGIAPQSLSRIRKKYQADRQKLT